MTKSIVFRRYTYVKEKPKNGHTYNNNSAAYDIGLRRSAYKTSAISVDPYDRYIKCNFTT